MDICTSNYFARWIIRMDGELESTNDESYSLDSNDVFFGRSNCAGGRARASGEQLERYCDYDDSAVCVQRLANFEAAYTCNP